jgi:hypothetical protein
VDPVKVLSEWYSQMKEGDIQGAIAKFHSQAEWFEADHSPYRWPGPLSVSTPSSAASGQVACDWEHLRVVAQEFWPAGSTVLVIGGRVFALALRPAR